MMLENGLREAAKDDLKVNRSIPCSVCKTQADVKGKEISHNYCDLLSAVIFIFIIVLVSQVVPP